MDFIDAVRRQAWDSRFYDFPAEAKAVPTMLTEEEGRMLCWLGEHYYQAKGAVVDLGSFLGGSTVRLASGLERSGLPWTMHSYDRFMIEERFKQKYLYSAGHPVFEGGDTLPLFEKFTAPYAPNIIAHKGEFGTGEPWGSREPIEILFVDLAKTIPTHHFVLNKFFPHLIPGRSIIVQQDYLEYQTPWLIVAMELLHPKIELISWTRDYSVLFLCNEVPSAKDLKRIRYDRLSQAVAEAQFRKARDRFPFEWQREILAVALDSYRLSPRETRAWGFRPPDWTQRPSLGPWSETTPDDLAKTGARAGPWTSLLGRLRPWRSRGPLAGAGT